MRINIAAGLASALVIVGASSRIVNQRDQSTNLHQRSFLESNRQAVEQLPPTCNLVACIGLQGTLTCVLSAVSTGDTSALRHCLSGGLGEICSCAACIAPVNNFLQALGICVAADVEDDVRTSPSQTFTASFETKSTYAPRPLTRPASRFDTMVWKTDETDDVKADPPGTKSS